MHKNIRLLAKMRYFTELV